MRRWHCQTCTRVPATRSVRVLPTTTLKNERGRREDRVPARTRGPRAAKVARGRTTGGAGSSGLPCAMVLRLIRDLPGDRALLPPSSVDHSTTLAPASGRQDHTISPSAPAPLVLRRQNVHRIPLPTSVTIAIRPSCGGGMARTLRLIWVSEKAKYFLPTGWTGIRDNCPSGKSPGEKKREVAAARRFLVFHCAPRLIVGWAKAHLAPCPPFHSPNEP